MKTALSESEASLAASIEYCDDTKATLEDALHSAQKEIEVLRVFYDDEVTRMSGLLSASSKKMDMMSDQLSELKGHFSTNKDYNNWRLAISKEAFASLPEKLASAAEMMKSCTDQELAVLLEVCSVFFFFSSLYLVTKFSFL